MKIKNKIIIITITIIINREKKTTTTKQKTNSEKKFDAFKMQLVRINRWHSSSFPL